jgi:hypothetical protein
MLPTFHFEVDIQNYQAVCLECRVVCGYVAKHQNLRSATQNYSMKPTPPNYRDPSEATIFQPLMAKSHDSARRTGPRQLKVKTVSLKT